MEIQILKTQLDIYQVADRLGIQINKYHKAQCPFHDDKRPSLQFSKEKQIATCFSSNCVAGTMDVIGLAEKKLNLSTHEAIKWLQQEFGLQDQKPIEAKPIPINYPKLFRVFEGNLKKSSKGKAYLEERGLNENLEVGYNGTAWEKMKHCVIFPLKDKQGQITSFYGRSTVAANHFYNSNRKGLYPGYPKAETETLILTESVIDNATLQQYTNHETLALYGTNGLITEHQEAIKELHQLKEIILFLDGDQAGKEAVKRNGEILQSLKPEIKLTYIETPENEDINSLAQSHEPTIFKHLIDHRKPLSFSVESLDTQLKPNATQPKARLITTNPELLYYQNCVLNFTVLGGIKITGLDRLRVTLKIEHQERNHLLPIRHNLDLYNNGQVEQLGQKVAEQMELTTQEAITAVAQLTNELEVYRERRLEALKPKKEINENQLSTTIKQQCMAFGKAPELMKRINKLVGQCGIIGEEKNRLALCVIASGHKNKATMHALIQGSSGSGKSHLMGAILDLMPKESVLCFTRVTESSLYNYGSHELKGKILGFEDWDGLEEKAEYAVRELISKEALVSSTSVKNEETGKISGAHHTVYGPVTTFACTTNGTIYEDNMNRVFVIAVDESREQTLRVIQYQNDKEAGLIDERKEAETREFLRNFMRTLEPCQVVNPFANKIQPAPGIGQPETA